MSVLDELVAGARADAAAREADLPLEAVLAAAGTAPAQLDPMPRFRASGLSVIAEVKRASPSKGALADIPDPAALAESYARGGAAAISVLTEGRRFAGSLDDLRDVRARVDVPVLRKDFIVTEYQLAEARAAGADLALLIVAALDDAQLAQLMDRARALGLTPLVEVHTMDETRRAVDAGADLIGINNRNLKTLDVDLATFGRLAEHVPDGVVTVAESGISTAADAAEVARQGADVVLVGEALVTGGDPVAGVAAMTTAAPRNEDD